MIIVTILFSALFLVCIKKNREEGFYRPLLGIVFYAVVYSYAFVIGVNCAFDKSEPKIFISEVTYKRTSSVTIEQYLIDVNPWEKNSKNKEISISKDLYKNIEKEDKVSIYVFNGLFDIPWVEVGYAR